MDVKPPILEFLHIVGLRKTSDFGVLNIINNIFKTMQNLRFLSFCAKVSKTSDFGVYFQNSSDFGFLRIVRRTGSDFGGFAAFFALQNRNNYIHG